MGENIIELIGMLFFMTLLVLFKNICFVNPVEFMLLSGGNAIGLCGFDSLYPIIY